MALALWAGRKRNKAMSNVTFGELLSLAYFQQLLFLKPAVEHSI